MLSTKICRLTRPRLSGPIATRNRVFALVAQLRLKKVVYHALVDVISPMSMRMKCQCMRFLTTCCIT
jgi:hypothetical protein